MPDSLFPFHPSPFTLHPSLFPLHPSLFRIPEPVESVLSDSPDEPDLEPEEAQA